MSLFTRRSSSPGCYSFIEKRGRVNEDDHVVGSPIRRVASRQGVYKRAACQPQPTTPSVYSFRRLHYLNHLPNFPFHQQDDREYAP